jgi:hypothetical protein
MKGNRMLHRFWAIGLMVLLFDISARSEHNTAPPVPTQPVTTQPGVGRKDWRELLQVYGKLFSLEFTIERDEFDNGPGSGKASPLLAHFVLLPTEVKDERTCIDEMKRWLPEADVTVEEVARPNMAKMKVVHVREKTLATRGQLALDEKISLLKFDGTVNELILELVKQGGEKLAMNRGGAVGEFPYDLQEKVHVDAKDTTYRSLLSKELPRNKNQILWEAIIVNRNGVPITLLKINGPSSEQPNGAQTTAPGPTTKP